MGDERRYGDVPHAATPGKPPAGAEASVAIHRSIHESMKPAPVEYEKITKDVFVRHPENPILKASDFPVKMRAVYNCAAVKTPDGRYAMLCRVNQLNHKTLLWGADSADGVHFTVRPEPFRMPAGEWWKRCARSVYFDPRVTFLDGEYKILLAVIGDQGCRVALFTSKDLNELEFVDFICAPDNRNMVLFPEKSRDGRYMRLERPSMGSMGGKGNIWLARSPDLIHWGDWREVLRTDAVWNYALGGLGPSTQPERTDEGWLIIFHAIMSNCTTRAYSAGAALLDLEEPWKVLHYTKHPILYPEAPYELTGLVEHVCFPCSKIIEPDGTVKLYYGGADTVQCLATARLADVIHACRNW